MLCVSARMKKAGCRRSRGSINCFSIDVDDRLSVSVFIHKCIGIEEVGSSIWWFWFDPSKLNWNFNAYFLWFLWDLIEKLPSATGYILKSQKDLPPLGRTFLFSFVEWNDRLLNSLFFDTEQHFFKKKTAGRLFNLHSELYTYEKVESSW